MCRNANKKLQKLPPFWVKFSADHILKYFLIFPENRFDISCILSPMVTIYEISKPVFSNLQFEGDNLYEMSKPVFWKNKKNIINLSAELAQRAVKVKFGKSMVLMHL